jgi:hypothetical protein
MGGAFGMSKIQTVNLNHNIEDTWVYVLEYFLIFCGL